MFEPRTNYFKKFSHTKLARQPPYYNIMVPTPLGCYCCVGEILTFFVRANCCFKRPVSRANFSKGAFRQGCIRGVPSLTASATILLLPNFTGAPPRTHAVRVLTAGG